jgi:hypothetical protein
MQDTRLNTAPYFDDFDRSKNFQKVLFKPGRSVQTRELNTIQSILQNQIERFGQHIFKEGSVVIPGNVGFNLDYNAVLVQNLVNGISVEDYREALVGKTITGLTSGVKAEIIDTLSQSESEKNTITLYVKYSSGGFFENGVQYNKFKNNEVLVDSTNTPVAVTTVQNSVAYTGSVVYINPGVYFIRGFFVEVGFQKIILDQYGTKPSYKIGLIIQESIVTSEDDETLFDNALGSTNYASPGADRLKIDLQLSKQNLLLTDDSNFIELLRMEEGSVVKLVEFSLYNELEKNLARRTFDESGSYTLEPYKVKIREALFDGENDGVYSPNQILQDGRQILDRDPTPDENNAINGKDYYALEVSEGKAYVKGFEIIGNKKQYAIVEKPRKSSNLNNKGVFLNIGSYFKLDNNQSFYGRVNFGDSLVLRDVDNNTIGECKCLGLTFGYFLYITELTIYTKLQLSTPNHGLLAGDLISGVNSGASAFVESFNSNTVTLRQVTGTFLPSEQITSSRVDYTTTIPTISQIQQEKLENVRKIQKSNSSFVAFIKLDSVKISGSSFTVSGLTLTGINTNFQDEISSRSKLLVGSTEVEVDSSTASSITLAASPTVTNGTYYNVNKLVCVLYTSKNGLTAKISESPVKLTTDYSYDIVVSQQYQVVANQVAINRPITEFIEASSVIVTSDTSILTVSTSQVNENSILISGFDNTFNGSFVNVYYKLRLSDSKTRTKTNVTYQKLIVDSVKSSSNTVYGTRLGDRELSLKFPDVYKIHAIHEALNPSDSNDDMFDTLVLNSTESIVKGDIITSGKIRAKVIEVYSTSVKVIYVSNSKFPQGTNLAISIEVSTNTNVVGRFIRESFYGKYKNITSNFTLVKNDTEEFYRVSKLVRRLNRPSPSNKIIVIFDYLKHEDLTNNFYTVDSYKNIDYSDIPYSYNKISYTDIVDFRYYILPSTTGSGTLTAPHKETVSSLDYKQNQIQSSSSFAYPQKLMSIDYDFYLGRIDKVFLNENGLVSVNKGSDSLTPKLPLDSGTGLLLATVTLPAYLKNISDAKINIERTKGYTMKDIGLLEDRLSNVETYTSLNLLEVNTNNLNILDEEGRNRFKNGFIVDKFNTVSIADLTNPDYSVSIDTDEYLVRPYPYVNNISFNLDATQSNSRKTGDLVTIPYEEISYISQPYSSRVENVNPFLVTNYSGNLILDPKKDVWYDTVRTLGQAQTIDLEGPIRFLFDTSGASGDQWGSWNTTGSTRTGGGTNIFQTRTGVNNSIDVTQQTIETGDTINSVVDIRFVRSTIIDASANSLKPNTNFSLYINDVDSNEFFYPKLITGLTGVNKKFVVGEIVLISPVFSDNLLRPSVVRGITAVVVNPYDYTSNISLIGNNFSLNQTSQQIEYSQNTTLLAIDDIRSADRSIINPELIGNTFTITGQTSGATALCSNKPNVVSNEVGDLHGFILIPEETFETGILSFSISDRPDNIVVSGYSLSNASTSFFAQGAQLNVTSSVVSVSVPEIVTTPISRDRTVFIPDPPPPPPAPPAAPAGRGDPLAQSFYIDTEGGVFATSIDLYFYTKDDSAPVTIDIRTIQNGTPTETIVPYSTVTVAAADINISTNASAATRFTFSSPVYLQNQTDYCFVVRSTSTKYYLWVSRLGENDVTTDFVIDKQPNLGVLFKSANMSTWEPDQFEDIKFNLNRAKFDTNVTVPTVLYNTPISGVKLISDPLTFTKNSAVIRVFQPNHGMHSSQSYVSINGVVSEAQNGMLSTNISNITNQIVVNDLSDNSFNYQASESWSKINNQNISAQNPGYIKIDNEIISYSSITNNNTFVVYERGALGTIAAQHSDRAVVECYNVNGIILSDVNTVHRVHNVINLDEYEILAPFKSNTTAVSGGSQITASRNIQYETITPQFNILTLPFTESNVSLVSTTATSIGNKEQISFILSSSESIENFAENNITTPRMIASETNRTRYFSNLMGTMRVNLNMSTTKDNVSPVIDLASSTIITISNRINKEVDQNDNIDISSELLPIGGLHSSYITKKVSLENSSTSIRVLFDAIRRQEVDIKVFAKTRSDSSLGSFNDANYIEIPAESYPTSQTENEYRSFEYEIKGLPEFKEWSIKIVLISNDQSNIPKIKNFRALALAI